MGKCWEWPYPLIPTVPALYMDAVSVEQQIKDLMCWLNSLSAYVVDLDYQAQIDAAMESLEALESEFEEFKASGFETYYETQLNTWIEKNMPDIWAKAMKMVFFGLTDDGYFCAYVPDNWEDITFTTEYDYDNDNYGHLILEY